MPPTEHMRSARNTRGQRPPFLEDPEEEMGKVDDCAPYVLTLVKGPVLVDSQELDFLNGFESTSSQPEGKLPDESIDRLKELFFILT